MSINVTDFTLELSFQSLIYSLTGVNIVTHLKIQTSFHHQQKKISYM